MFLHLPLGASNYGVTKILQVKFLDENLLLLLLYQTRLSLGWVKSRCQGGYVLGLWEWGWLKRL